jgi:hypothetical protein
VLGLPTAPYHPGTPDTVVLAYTLADVDDDTVRALADRAPGEVLVEHATCWTGPPPVTPDFTVLLGQSVVPPWGARLVLDPQAGSRRNPADDRATEAIADEIAAAEPARDEGDGDGPPDDDGVLTAFVTALGAGWPLRGGPRYRMRSPGPVRSSAFR